MKVMFIVYHDLQTEARSQELLECAKLLGDTILVSFSLPKDCSNCQCIVTGGGKRAYFSFIKDAIKAIKSEQPDVVVLHDNYTSPLFWWLKRLKKDVCVIYDSSELYIERRKIKSPKLIAGEILRFFERKYINDANITIGANVERAEIMRSFFNLKETPLVFDNIHKIEDEYNMAACEMKYGHLFTEKFSIVYGGGIAKARLTYELAKAVGKLGDEYQLVVVGATTEAETREFHSMLSDRNITNVVYLGFIPRGEWRYLLHKAQISVSAFAQDTVNNINCASGKLYESLFEGTPVLVTENPPLKRICSEYKIGVSTNDFYKGILELRDNYGCYCDNVQRYVAGIEFDGRIPALAAQIKKKINRATG